MVGRQTSPRFRQTIERILRGTSLARDLPQHGRIPSEFIAEMMRGDMVYTADRDPFKAQHDIARCREDQLVLLPLEHRIDAEHGNNIRKDVLSDHYLNLDTATALNHAIESAERFYGREQGQRVRSQQLMKHTAPKFIYNLCVEHGLYPKWRIDGAVKERQAQLESGASIEPPLGFRYIGENNMVTVVSWSRAIRGLNEHRADRERECPITFDKAYPDNVRAMINSDSSDSRYTLTFQNLPIFHQHDNRQFGTIYDLILTDSTADAVFQGEMHRRAGVRGVQYITTNLAHGWYDIASWLSSDEAPNNLRGKRIYINLIPMLRSDRRLLISEQHDNCDGDKYWGNLCNRAFFVDYTEPNLTEKDRLIGARVVGDQYWSMFQHARSWRQNLVRPNFRH